MTEPTGAYHDGYDTVVYDLDGTLVELAVDWGVVAEDVEAVYDSAGIDPPSDDLWDLLEVASDDDLLDEVEAAIAPHERAGARDSTRLPHADGLVESLADRTAVCSLNCADACRIALETHGLMGGVGAVVGRDSVRTQKPDPNPLLEAIELIGGDPATTVFVGDSVRDRTTAERAGVDFEWV